MVWRSRRKTQRQHRFASFAVICAVLALGLTERGRDLGLAASASIAGEGTRGWNERTQDTFSASAPFHVSLRLKRRASVGALFSPKEGETPMGTISPEYGEVGISAMGARQAASSQEAVIRPAATPRSRRSVGTWDGLASSVGESEGVRACATRGMAKALHRAWIWIAAARPRVYAGKVETGADA